MADIPPDHWRAELQSQLAQSRRLLRDLQELAAQSAELAKLHAQLARQHVELTEALRRLKQRRPQGPAKTTPGAARRS